MGILPTLENMAFVVKNDLLCVLVRLTSDVWSKLTTRRGPFACRPLFLYFVCRWASAFPRTSFCCPNLLWRPMLCQGWESRLRGSRDSSYKVFQSISTMIWFQLHQKDIRAGSAADYLSLRIRLRRGHILYDLFIDHLFYFLQVVLSSSFSWLRSRGILDWFHLTFPLQRSFSPSWRFPWRARLFIMWPLRVYSRLGIQLTILRSRGRLKSSHGA